ncbi:MAG: carbohydrate kinase family protein [Acidobacteriia bacterium]|nr:carbohydrate kinase family protein [Terriglobia bacterium]
MDLVGIGLNATDTLLLVDEFPPYAGKVPFQRELLSPGGQVATAVVTCARLGLRAKYIGTVGDDLRGQIQRESLEGTGVDTSAVIIRAGCPNQTAYILIDARTGERTVLWHRADSLRLMPCDIQRGDIAGARMLHIDGFDTDAADYAARIAREHRIPVSLDVDTVYAGFVRVLKNVDYLVAGSHWTQKWTGEPDPFKALSQLRLEYGFLVAATTLGSEGALALADSEWHYSPAFEVRCVDTTGAGDVFHGAFCYAMLSGMSIDCALEFSNAAGALNCTAIGARGHIPCRGEVNALIEASAAGKVRRHESPEILEQMGSAVAATGI